MNWFIQLIINAILNWIAGLFGRAAADGQQAIDDQKANSDIEKAVEDAANEKEAQNALDQAAKRAGRSPYT